MRVFCQTSLEIIIIWSIQCYNLGDVWKSCCIPPIFKLLDILWYLSHNYILVNDVYVYLLSSSDCYLSESMDSTFSKDSSSACCTVTVKCCKNDGIAAKCIQHTPIAISGIANSGSSSFLQLPWKCEAFSDMNKTPWLFFLSIWMIQCFWME